MNGITNTHIFVLCATVKFLNIRTPNNFAVNTLKPN